MRQWKEVAKEVAPSFEVLVYKLRFAGFKCGYSLGFPRHQSFIVFLAIFQ